MLAGGFALGSARVSEGVMGKCDAGSDRRDGSGDGAVAGSSGARGSSAGRSTRSRGRCLYARCDSREPPPVPGRVANFQSNVTWAPLLVVEDDAPRHETHSGRDKENLERYCRDQKQLKHSFAALEEQFQLARMTKKLKQMDSKVASRIEGLESKLREPLDPAGGASAKAVRDQGEAIKSPRKKLVRQAHIIKKQNNATEGCKAMIDVLREVMPWIEGLESKLIRESAEGLSAKTVGGQGRFIKSLRKKLVQQAHDIKKQNNATEGCKAWIEGLREAIPWIEDLESNLQESRHVTDHAEVHPTRAVKSPGKKHERQDYFIKKHQDAAEECESWINALREAMPWIEGLESELGESRHVTDSEEGNSANPSLSGTAPGTPRQWTPRASTPSYDPQGCQ